MDASGRPRHDAARPAPRECHVCPPRPGRISVGPGSARLGVPQRRAALCRRGRGPRLVAARLLRAVRTPRQGMHGHPRRARHGEPHPPLGRRCRVQHAAREDQPEPLGVDASGHGLLHGSLDPARRCPAFGRHPGPLRRNGLVARRPRQPQLDRGASRRRMALHGVLPALGPRPRLVPGRCRAGCAGRAEICDLCRFVPPHGRLVPDGLERRVARHPCRGRFAELP